MSTASKLSRTNRINIRASAKQEDLIRRGAEMKGKNLTEFILESACTEAEIVLTEQRQFVLSSDRWEAFVRALDRPAQVKPRLKQLMEQPSVLET